MEINADDLAEATRWLSRLDPPLRTPDAIHLAACGRLGSTLLTFDVQMARAAEALGIALERA